MCLLFDLCLKVKRLAPTSFGACGNHLTCFNFLISKVRILLPDLITSEDYGGDIIGVPVGIVRHVCSSLSCSD